MLASAATVIVLGLLAEGAARPASETVVVGTPVQVTALPGDSVWDLAHRVAPAAPAAEIARLAERIVVENALTSARLDPGQVLWVPTD